MTDVKDVAVQISMGHLILRNVIIPTDEEIAEHRECSVCHEPFFTGMHREIPMKFPCGHTFGSLCIQIWISRVDKPGSCPVCWQTVFDDYRGDTSQDCLDADPMDLDLPDVDPPDENLSKEGLSDENCSYKTLSDLSGEDLSDEETSDEVSSDDGPSNDNSSDDELSDEDLSDTDADDR